MPHRYEIDPAQRLIVVVYTGKVEHAEELCVQTELIEDPRYMPEPRILVDRRQSRMGSVPDNIHPHLDSMKRIAERLQGSRHAHVTNRDRDFGILRMVELTSADDRGWEIAVFRDLDPACAWLGIDELPDMQPGPAQDAESEGESAP